MTKRTFVWVTILALAVVSVGVVTASNMAFKLNYRLDAVTAGVSKSGTSTLALPYNRQTGITTASDLINDIGLANVANVQQFAEATDTFAAYTGRKGTGPNFNLVAGDANLVQMNTAVDYIVVGSDNPSLAVPLNSVGASSRSGTNLFSYPYHSTSPTAFDLMNDIGFSGVANVQNFVKSSDTWVAYTGRKGTGPNFNLAPGAGYLIQMNSTVNYVPSHY